MTDTDTTEPLRVKVGSVTFLKAAGSGYRDAMAERAAFLRSALARMEAPE